MYLFFGKIFKLSLIIKRPRNGKKRFSQITLEYNLFFYILIFVIFKNADLACVNSDRELPVDLAENDEMRNYLEEVMRLKDVDERKARESEFNTMLEDCNRFLFFKLYLSWAFTYLRILLMMAKAPTQRK